MNSKISTIELMDAPNQIPVKPPRVLVHFMNPDNPKRGQNHPCKKCDSEIIFYQMLSKILSKKDIYLFHSIKFIMSAEDESQI